MRIERSAAVLCALAASADIVDAIRARMGELALDGWPIPPAKWHLTLAFLGRCHPADLPAVHERANGIRLAPFDLTLDRLGCFQRPGIVWRVPDDTPAPLAHLAACLAVCLAPPALEKRLFVPHISLTRKSRLPADIGRQSIAPIRWPMSSFCLIESGAGDTPGAYRTLSEWPLVGPARPATME